MDRFISMRNAGRLYSYFLASGLLLLLLVVARSHGQSVEVTLHVEFNQNAPVHHALGALVPVVAWLSPLDVTATAATPRQAHTYQMVQKDKMFDPHLLVIPLGSYVVFPNRDSYFHNVFSLFNGKRFDLGLYEAGTERRVRFDREGISYIFCNIHPEMGAVILSLATPYYSVSHEGTITISQIPPGRYLLNLWSEGATPESLNAVRREVTVSTLDINLGAVSLSSSPSPVAHHANKFGEPYPASSKSASPGSVY
ncbi:MAG: hypothetical protein ABR907_10055 [Terracidiphilus sp.]|jgi:plastocyanin